LFWLESLVARHPDPGIDEALVDFARQKNSMADAFP
jgi:hypothetical protein